jgi:cation-transporting ATPase 13A1
LLGVALLSHPFDASANQQRQQQLAAATAAAAASSTADQNGNKPADAPVTGNRRRNQPPPPSSNLSVGRRPDAPAGARVQSRPVAANPAAKRLEEMMKQIEEEEKAQVVRLGDASIAAPFTSKYTSIQSSQLDGWCM